MYRGHLLAAVGFAGLTRRSKSSAALQSILSIPLVGTSNIVKLESWDPHCPNREYVLLEMQRLQEARPGVVHFLVVTARETGQLGSTYGFAVTNREPSSSRILRMV